MANKYCIGVDYGTQSGRAVLVDLSNGEEISEHVTLYKHQVIDEQLPNSEIKLLQDWALQHPQDYVEVLEQSIPAVVAQANIAIDDIIGIGIDFTACTMLPIDGAGAPLCYNSIYRDNPHSWVKLWKHHAAQEEANMINELAESRQENWLQRYGGKISSEWMLPKIWQTLREAPHIYEEADQFVEAADWIVSQLTGTIVRNSCTAGYKALWNKREGYPSTDFFAALDERLANVTTTKLRGDVLPLGTKAGELTAEMAERLQLKAGIAVAVATIDAHAAVPAVGVVEPNQLVMTMGTSICHLLLSDEEKHVPGVGGVVEDGIIPGYFAYEAGQAAVGDILEWYIEEMVPAYVTKAAEAEGQNIHQYLTDKAAAMQVGESGLLALDWWNGNRSILIDANLTGMIVGMHLQTKPWEIYRALIEATAFGTRKIIETFEQNDLPIEQIVACGGLAKKNALLMQIYADVSNKEIKVSASNQTTAVGAAMFAAVAAGEQQGGYQSLVDAADKMVRLEAKQYVPIEENVERYNRLYAEYTTLHDYFGTGINDVMKRLK